MAVELSFVGHATWLLKTGNHTILIDPFFTDNPQAGINSAEVTADVIVVSHGHFDHIADCVEIARNNNAPVIANFEIAQWLEKQGVEQTVGMNIGGTLQQAFGSVKLTHAIHSSQLPDGSYGGNPAGLYFVVDGFRIYFACDTELFSDMKYVGDQGVDAAVFPIGDLFTMGPDTSIQATNLVQPKYVLPAHFNTWPPIEQDAQQWAEQIRQNTSAEPIVLEPGGSHTFG